MSRAIALAATHQDPFKAAAASAENFVKLVCDYMYGTPLRIQITIGFMTALMVLSMTLNTVGHALLQGCPV